MTPIKRLLLATDFSDWARRAEHYACSLAASWQIPLTIMTVLEFPPGMDPEYALNKHYLTERMDEASFRLADFKSRAILKELRRPLGSRRAFQAMRSLPQHGPRTAICSLSGREAPPVSLTSC